MKETEQVREYRTPEFKVIRHDDANRTFFTASAESSGSKSFGLQKMSSVDQTW